MKLRSESDPVPTLTRPAVPPAGAPQRVPPRPLISVCIANHDYGRFLPDAIDSALAQTYPNVELVVVDDGSTDDSRAVIRSYGERIRPIFQACAGQAAAGWTALQEARGDVVVFLDADDTLEPEICGRVAAAFERDPTLVLVQWRLRTIDAAGAPLGRVLPPRPGLLASGDLADHVLRIRDWHSQLTSGVAFATWALRRCLPAVLPEGERHGLDHWLSALVPLLGPVASLAEIGGGHRIHGANFSAFEPSTAEWPRRLLRLTLSTHEHLRSLAADVGRPCPSEVPAQRDPAFLGWRLWSLAVDPAGHPFPGDRRFRLAAQGAAASLRHPHFPRRHRLKRVGWFLAVGALPRGLARRVIARDPAGGPLSLARRRP